ncbi:hypothetical protein Q0M94_28495 (plasmid) [Deinococcus radiomollis]|uniref:hypothetical protein n=1 Tax=Deinococcus radiomollis TaxID=468916 RepID=UPI0038926C69
MSYCEVCGVPSEYIICDGCADLQEGAQDQSDPALCYGGNTPEESALRAELFAALDERQEAAYRARWAIGPAEVHRAASDAQSAAQARVDAARAKLVELTGLFGGGK